MELIKQESPIEFVWKDVTFLIRPTATSGDKYALSTGAPIDSEGKQAWRMADFWKKIIELFVVGWRGVTEDGKDTPFSLDALARLPLDANDDVFLRLGSFIVDHTKIIDKNVDQKNASGQS